MDQLSQKTKDNISNHNYIENVKTEEKEKNLNKNDFKQEKSSLGSKISKIIII